MQEVIRYASEWQIIVIPEIDVSSCKARNWFIPWGTDSLVQ
ncbi:hypothetical protein [Lacibacter sp.]